MHNPRVVVCGDLILDEFVYGDVTRISPEAPTPIISISRTVRMLGGAGNVARGIAALDCSVDLVGVVGGDESGRVLLRELHAVPTPFPWIVVDQRRATTHKTRFVSERHSAHLLRVDREDTTPVSGATEQSILTNGAAALTHEEAAVLVLTDYCKGTLTDTLVRAFLDIATVRRILTIVDTKRTDLSVFRGADILKLNLDELKRLVPNHASIEDAARQICREHDIDRVVVTQGEHGIMVVGDKGLHFVVPGRRVRVQDVSGAGDTVVATMAVSRARGQSLRDAVGEANVAASIVVGKSGTAAVTAAEIETGGKVTHSANALVDQRLKEWAGLKIGFTNGCFDLLHPGHLNLLTTARDHCDKLIVGLNSDDSVLRIKGAGRPVQPQSDRAAVLSALDVVDLVVIFDEDTPDSLCSLIRPHTIFKGGDYDPQEVRGAEHATHVHIVPLVEGVSTTETVNRIRTRPFVAIDIDPYCGECLGPCMRRPRHGESGL